MRRTVGALAIIGAVLGLSACGRDDIAGQVRETDTVTITETASPSAAPSPCRPSAGSDSCMIAGSVVTGDLTVTGKKVVRLTDVRVTGSVVLNGSTQVAVTGSTISGGLRISTGGAATVSGTTVGGALRIDGARVVTLTRATVAGDLVCSARRAGGSGNTVGGDSSGQCSDLG